MPQLSLTMIVKDEGKYLGDCLESVKDIADEIIIVDTGSTDDTIEIAKNYGAKIFNFEWANDFSLARNYALSKAKGDWILYLDADERLDARSKSELKKLVSSNQRIGYYCTVLSLDRDSGRDNSIRYVRLFANYHGIYFSGKVHEQIEPSLIYNGYTLIQSRILIHHIGYNVTKELKQAKAKRNLFLLLEEYENNKSPYVAFQLAMTYNVLEDEDNAGEYFKIASESGKLDRYYRAQCCSTLALYAFKNHKIVDAEKLAHYAIKIDDKQPFAQLLASKIALRKGELGNAEERCKRAYVLNQYMLYNGESFALAVVLDPEEVIYYGLTIALQNKNSQNIQFYKKELTLFYSKSNNPEDVQKINTVERLFSNSNLLPNEVNPIVKMINKNNLTFFINMLSSNPAKQTVLVITEHLLKIFNNSHDVLKLYARMLESVGQVDDAVTILEKIAEENDDDTAVFFYLVSFYLKQGQETKIKPIIVKMEKNFAGIPDVMTRVRTLKRKLLMLTSIPL